jgi:hypothetical protein
MSTRVVLSDSYILVRILEYSTPVMIDVQVIGSREYSDNRWEISSRCFPIHRVPKEKQRRGGVGQKKQGEKNKKHTQHLELHVLV